LLFGTYLYFNPNAKDNGEGIDEYPHNSQAKESKAGDPRKKEDQQNGERQNDPQREDPFVANVVHCEAEVVGQQFHNLYVILNSQLCNKKN
jgi:hypothetical protein